jgi:hypothetical protein
MAIKFLNTVAVDTDVLYVDASNNRVGIGTTSPSQPLHVNGNARVDGDFFIIESNPQIFLSDTNHNSDFSINLNSGLFKITDTTNSSDRITLDSSGNVGIGTTSPASKLTVFGDIMLKNPNGGNPTDAGSFIFNEVGTTWGTDIYGFRFNLNGSSNILTLQSANTTTVNDIMSFTRDTTLVGIGTTSPSYTLDVAGIINTNSHYRQSGVKILGRESNNTVLESGGANDIILETNSSEKMRITSSGNVGIGTTSPIGAVHIIGPNTNSAMTTSALVVEQSDGAKILIDGNDIDAAAGMLYLNDYSTNDVVFGGQIRVGGGGSPVGNSWFANGNVGIGTTSPSYRLDVQENTNGPVARIWNTSSSTGGNGLSVSAGLSVEPILTLGNYLQQEKFRFTAEGRLGIGTNAPEKDLHIKNGTYPFIKMQSEGYYPGFEMQFTKGASTNEGHIKLYRNPGMNSFQFQKYHSGTPNSRLELKPNQVELFTSSAYQSGLLATSTAVSIYSNYSTAIRINASGNVGIGTTSPSEKLEVNGSVKATAATDAYKGYIKSVITAGYSMKSASTAYQYIPYNSYTLTTSQAYYNRTVAAYNGRVKKIIVKRIDGASADATGMKFKKEINGTVIATEYTATVLHGSGNFQATYNFGNNDFTFSAGDSIGVLMQSSGGTGMIGAGAIQIVLEYNIT